MRSALILTYGTRGDHEPAIALSTTLVETSKFDTVHIVIQPPYEPLLPNDSRIIPHILPSPNQSPPVNNKRTSSRLRSDLNLTRNHHPRPFASSFLKPIDQMKTYNNSQRCQLRDNIIPSLPIIHSIAISNQPCVIISTPRFHCISVTIAEYLSVPVILLQLLPTLPTTRFPHLLSSTSASIRAANWIAASQAEPSPSSPRKPRHEDPHATSYYRYRRWMLGPSLSKLNILRSRLHLPEIQLDGYATPHYHFPKPFIINTYPTQVVPRIPELMACSLHVPPLAADFIPSGWDPHTECPKLLAYLQKRRSETELLNEPPQRPVCVSFGPVTVPKHRRRQLTKNIFNAFRACGVTNIIIVSNDMDKEEENDVDENKTSNSRGRRWRRHVNEDKTKPSNENVRTSRLRQRSLLNKSSSIASMSSSSTLSRMKMSLSPSSSSDIIGAHWLNHWDDDLKRWARHNVYHCSNEEYIRFAWLFPKCKAIITHGGVGTIATALRYGVPCVIAPSSGDQFFWGHLIANTNLGAIVGPDLLSASQVDFQKALSLALSSSIRLQLESIGRKVRKEGSGAVVAANVIARVVSSRGY